MKKLAAPIFLLLSLLLAGCQIDSTVNFDSDGTAKGTLHAVIPKADAKQSCEAFRQSFNDQVKTQNPNPANRLFLTIDADKSDSAKLDCAFSFKDWDPNLPKQVLFTRAYSTVLHTTEPAKLLTSLGENLESLQLTLVFPQDVTFAPGGEINGKQVTYTSAQAFSEAEKIVAGNAAQKSFWESYGLTVIFVGGALLALFCGFVIYKYGHTAATTEEE